MAKVVHFEIGGTDTAKAADFYGSLFGWSFMGAGPATMIDGAGLTGHLSALGHAPHNYCLVYIGVEDIRETLRRSSEFGGKTLIGPHEIPTGTFAWIQDPTGTTVGLWEAARPGDDPAIRATLRGAEKEMGAEGAAAEDVVAD